MRRKRPNGRFLRRFGKSKRGVNTILAELFMVLIVLIMSVIVFAFYSGVFGALLGTVRIHPENFQIVASGTPGSGGFDPNSIHPVGSAPSISTSGTVCTSSSPINSPVSGVYVPPGQSCTITSSVSSGVVVNYGATLIVQGGSITGGLKDNNSASITIQGGSTVTGGIKLYGTGSFHLTASQISSGSVDLNGVKYASIASTTGPGLSGGLQASYSGSVQVDSNTITGGTFFTNDSIVSVTNNTGSGGLHFSNDPSCYSANNTISGGVSGTCTGYAPSGGLDIVNTGSSTITFVSVYLDSQPWNGVSWQLATGSTEQCGGTAIPLGPCTQMPIVVPPNTMVHISFSWVNPTPNSVVNILMWTVFGNYLEARVDPNAGLVCWTRSGYGPRPSTGIC